VGWFLSKKETGERVDLTIEEKRKTAQHGKFTRNSETTIPKKIINRKTSGPGGHSRKFTPFSGINSGRKDFDVQSQGGESDALPILRGRGNGLLS